MELSLGFSPCPNDAFIFDAMIHKKIDLEGISFKVYMEDVETLNRRALAKELDVSKLSFHALGYLIDDYVLLDSGAALGNNCGPLLIAKKECTKEEINQSLIAIPGKYTTANFLFSLAYPEAKHKKEMAFSAIEHSVIANDVKAGVIIHENRFTYERRGLVKIIDLGEYWEKLTGLPIPLGGIVVKRRLPEELQLKINRIMRRSVEYAFAYPESSKSFVKEHAQEIEEEITRKHIDLYVNNYTLGLGKKGRDAVSHLFAMARDLGITPIFKSNIFIN